MPKVKKLRLFVGGVSYTTTEEVFYATFVRFGSIHELGLAPDSKERGRPHAGFGFVVYDDPRAAGKAIAALNGTQLGGRTITVAKAKERKGKRKRARATTDSYEIPLAGEV